MQIDIDFDVYKALTAKRESENHTFNEVLRGLLALDSPVEPINDNPFEKIADILSKPVGVSGFYSRGVFLPDGTRLRARYKQKYYTAMIVGEKWVGEHGVLSSSPSAAASAITGTNINGLRFWEAKRPSDEGWRRLELLRS